MGWATTKTCSHIANPQKMIWAPRTYLQVPISLGVSGLNSSTQHCFGAMWAKTMLLLLLLLRFSGMMLVFLTSVIGRTASGLLKMMVFTLKIWVRTSMSCGIGGMMECEEDNSFFSFLFFLFLCFSINHTLRRYVWCNLERTGYEDQSCLFGMNRTYLICADGLVFYSCQTLVTLLYSCDPSCDSLFWVKFSITCDCEEMKNISTFIGRKPIIINIVAYQRRDVC